MNGIVKVALIGGGAWLLYEWWSQQQIASVPGSVPSSSLPTPTPGPLGTVVSSSPTATVASSSPAPTTVQLSTLTLQQQMQSLAGQNMASTGATGFDVDQWNYFYSQVRGVPVTSAQGEAIIQALGLTDAQRATPVPLTNWLTAAGSAGLSGYRGRGMGAAPYLLFRNPAKIIRLPLTTPAIAAIRRGVAVRRGQNYIPANTPMVGGAA